MAISDSQYLAWLQKDGVRRVVLVEVQVYSGSSITTRYLSNSAYASFPSDTPANQPYDDLLLEIPRFSNSMSEAFGGASKPAFGDVVIDNSSGARDSWLNDSWAGYPINIYLGDVSWAKSDFRLILSGITADIQARDNASLIVKMRDKQDLLNKPVNSNLYTTGSAVGLPKPLCYGQCYQVEPILIDSATHKYQIHDGAINGITTVYENGYTIPFTADLANGCFTLPANPAGHITADCTGAKPSGTYITKVADIALDLITRAGLSGSDISSTSLAAMNTLCPQTVGLFIKDRTNLLPALDELVASVQGYYGFGRDGKFQMGRLSTPAGSPTLYLIADDIEQYGVTVKTVSPPIKTYRMGYKQYYTILSDGVAGAVTETVRADYLNEYRAVTATNTVTGWPLAAEPELVGGNLAIQSEAQTECNRRAALFSVPRKVLQVKAFTAPQRIELGQEINITYPRYGLNNGVNGIVIGVSESPTSSRVDLEVWL
jgi:hypothetical protein